MEASRKQLNTAKQEVTAATSFLDETRDRLRVIDVDAADDSKARDGGLRKRKASTTSNDGRANTTRTEARAAAPAADVAPAAASARRPPIADREDAVPQGITVRGAGLLALMA